MNRYVFLLFILFGSTSAAQPLVVHLERPLGGPVVDRTMGEWITLSPSVGVDVFSIDLSDRSYRVGVAPGVGYGIRWKPAFWTSTQSFLALDLYLQGVLNDADTNRAGPEYFAVDVLPVVTLMDWVGVGFGWRGSLSLAPEMPDKSSAVFTFGLRKSI